MKVYDTEGLKPEQDGQRSSGGSSRSWYLRGLLFLVMTGVAVAVLLPSVLPERDWRPVYGKHFSRRIQPGPDIHGLRLVYEVDMERLLPLARTLLGEDVDPATVRERAIQSAVKRLDSLFDQNHEGGRVFREGDRIVLELPGNLVDNPGQVERVRVRVSTATNWMHDLRFALVAQDAESMRKLAALLPDGGAIEMVTETPNDRGDRPVLRSR
jgi:hypothetical protein